MQKQKRKPRPQQITQQQPAITETESPPINSEKKRYSLPLELQAPPMIHATKAWCKAAIKRQLQNGVFELDRIIANTGISAETATELYIEITPD